LSRSDDSNQNTVTNINDEAEARALVAAMPILIGFAIQKSEVIDALHVHEQTTTFAHHNVKDRNVGLGKMEPGSHFKLPKTRSPGAKAHQWQHLVRWRFEVKVDAFGSIG
jgi:hypothetical protein